MQAHGKHEFLFKMFTTIKFLNLQGKNDLDRIEEIKAVKLTLLSSANEHQRVGLGEPESG